MSRSETMMQRAATTAEETSTTRGWHEDPWRLHKERFHDGSEWTTAVTHFGPVPCPGCDQYRN